MQSETVTGMGTHSDHPYVAGPPAPPPGAIPV